MPTALILGCAECVWDDAAAALKLFTPDAYIAVKDMMVLWPLRVDLGCTLHPDRTAGYLRQRAKLGRSTNFDIWAHREAPIDGTKLTHRYTPDWQGSSALFAVKVAIEQGFDAIVLAGVPLDPKQGHVVRRKDWNSASMFRRGWDQHLPQIKEHTRSMSGVTMGLLGAPTAEWLSEHGSAPPDENVIRLLQKETGNACAESSS